MDGESEQEEDAQQLKNLAETKYKNSNLKSALRYAVRAQRLDPKLDGISEMVTSFEILRVAAKSPKQWYKILQVEPFAHINTIKKQYKKLALALHPDKNPYSGSEEAFKLVGEAFRFLSDKVRRKEYDMKLRIQIQDEKIGGRLETPEAKETFWTTCSICRLLHQFERRYVGHNLMCPSCKKSFKAVEVETNVSVGEEDRIINFRSRRSGGIRGVTGSCLKRKISNGEKLRCVELNGSVGGNVNRKGLKSVDLRREVGSEKDRSEEENGKVGGVAGGGRLRRRMSNVGGQEVLERSKTRRVKTAEDMMTLAEMQIEAICKAKMKLKLKIKEKVEKIGIKEEVKEEEEDDEEEMQDKKRRIAKNNRDIRIERQASNSKKRKISEIVKHGNSRKTTNLKSERPVPSDASGDLELINVEDSDFYDFDKDRMERSFKKGQVWAIYDDDDGMPRHYALIDEVVSASPFEVKIIWLDLQSKREYGLISTEKIGFRLSCGRYKIGQKTCVVSLNIFSHVVDSERAAREIYRIYPKKGSVWALYKEGIDVSKDDQSYDIVVFLTTYSEMHGLSMAYLEKVDGYKTIFKRQEIGAHAIRWLEKDEVSLFSHQIPARKLSGDEALKNLKDCWELDPASLPSNLLTISRNT